MFAVIKMYKKYRR